MKNILNYIGKNIYKFLFLVLGILILYNLIQLNSTLRTVERILYGIDRSVEDINTKVDEIQSIAEPR